jgi:hypothetical protein
MALPERAKSNYLVAGGGDDSGSLDDQSHAPSSVLLFCKSDWIGSYDSDWAQRQLAAELLQAGESPAESGAPR